jgi:hypothetical protein
MATVERVERQIAKVEGFNVRIRHGRDNRDVRGDKTGIPGYDYKRRLGGARNVKDWREGRFARRYPGYAVDVLKEDGTVAHGGTLLDNVRGS